MYSVSQKYLNKKNSKKDNKGNKSKKISTYNFKNIYKNENRNILHKSQSNKKDNNMESNFMKLCKDSNIYTSNVNYIKNQKCYYLTNLIMIIMYISQIGPNFLI